MIDTILDFYYTMTILQEKNNDLRKNDNIRKNDIQKNNKKEKLNLNNIKIND